MDFSTHILSSSCTSWCLGNLTLGTRHPMSSRGNQSTTRSKSTNHGTRCWNGPERNVIVSLHIPSSPLVFTLPSFIFELLISLTCIVLPQQLLLTCGTENAILTVQELEKCEYQFTGTTPALCLPLVEEKNGGSREEL
jgi:protein kinase C substrate 80K-H